MDEEGIVFRIINEMKNMDMDYIDAYGRSIVMSERSYDALKEDLGFNPGHRIFGFKISKSEHDTQNKLCFYSNDIVYSIVDNL